MAQRTVPGIGLTAFWVLGYDGWKTEMDANLLKTSVLVQPRVISRVTALPGSPTDGDIYIVPSGGDADKIAVRDNGAWTYYVPAEGYVAYVADENTFFKYDGADWVDMFSGGVVAAEDVSFDPTGLVNTAATDVQAAMEDLDGAIAAGAGIPTGYLDTDGTLAANSDVKVATQKATKTYADTKIPSSYLDTDGTLAANSDVKVATQKAVKTYADALIAANDAMVFKGVIDCSANPNYPAADRGHQYRISVAGKIGGALGINVEVGDMILCLTDGSASNDQATVGANWSVIQTNLDGAVINTRQIISGTGLTGGANLSADITLNVGAGTGILANANDVAIDKATAANVWAATSNKVLTSDIIFTAADPVTLTDAATIAVDMSTFLNAKVTLTANRALGAPSNPKNGQSGCIEIIQDGSGSHTLSYHADWLFSNGTDPTLSTAAGAKDLLFFQVMSNGKTYANLVKAIA